VRHRQQCRDTNGRGRAQTDINRDTQRQGHCRLRQGYRRTGPENRRTGKGTQTDRDSDTDRQAQGHIRTGAGTRTDWERDTDGQGQGK
jgi:hypothetical protein